MAQTIGGIVCEELVEAFGESFDLQAGASARKGFLCNWADRFTVVIGLLGLQSTVSVGGGITLHVPLAYPEMSLVYAHSVEIRGAGPPTQGFYQLQYPKAIVLVNYRQLPWSFGGIDYSQIDPSTPYVWAEQHLSFSSEFITVPGKHVMYENNSKMLDQDWGFMSPKCDLSITIKNVPYLPAQLVLQALAAPVNSSAYLGIAAGHLLFNGIENHRTNSSNGDFTQDVTYSFSFRPIAPWDYVFNSSGWTRVVQVGTGNPVVQRSDLSGIIPSEYG